MAWSLTNPGLIYGDPAQTDPLTGKPIAPVKYFKNEDARNAVAQPALQAVHQAIQAEPLNVTQPQATFADAGHDTNGNPLPPTMSASGGSIESNPSLPVLPQMFKPKFQDVSQGPYGLPTQVNLAETKIGKLLHILRAVGEGAAAGSQAGTFGGGFDIAQKEPYEDAARQMQAQGVLSQLRYGPQQAQAALAETRAKTAQTEAQTKLLGTSVPVTLPNGQQIYIPASQIGQYTRGALGAQIGGEAKVATTKLQNQNKLDAIKLQTEITKQKGVRFLPDVGEDGQQFYHVMNPFGQEIGQSDVNVIPSFMTRNSSTVDFKEDENGNIIALPKTTVSQPSIPSKAASVGGGGVTTPGIPAASASSRAASGSPRVVAKGKVPGMAVGTDPQGRQIAGTPEELRAVGAEHFTKLDSGESAKVNTARQLTSPNGLFALIDQDLSKFKPGELETIAPRWNEFLAGKVGTMPTGPDGKQDTRYVALRTHVNGLLSTALMQAHVGARGGERIMEHFEDIANSGKMSLPMLKAALDAERAYVEEKAMRPQAKQASSGASPEIHYKIVNGKLVAQ